MDGAPGTCALCNRILSSENDDSISRICGDCKFLFLEDGGTPSSQRRTPRVRRTRYNNNSSESIESLFSQQFSNMLNVARNSQTVVSELDSQSVDSRVTPTGSRRWRRVVSDTESEGFDSVYGESDVVSYGPYGGDTDASVDVDSFYGDSDTDIDPMHAGLNQWSSDDDDDDDDDDDADENTLGSLIARVHLRRSEGPNPPFNWLTELRSPEAAVHIRISERRQVHMEGDYLDARSFEELVERLAEADNPQRGAPPAAVSFVNNLERVVVKEEQQNGLSCAICKDSLSVGSVVNRLPCLHLYHPPCIKPWLSVRNSCPLCRYELPTDDLDYENRKQSSRNQQQQQEEDASSEEEHEVPLELVMNDNGRGRGRWLFVVAPVVSLVGIAVALWLGNRGAVRSCGSGSPSQRGSNRSRRWWSLF